MFRAILRLGATRPLKLQYSGTLRSFRLQKSWSIPRTRTVRTAFVASGLVLSAVPLVTTDKQSSKENEDQQTDENALYEASLADREKERRHRIRRSPFRTWDYLLTLIDLHVIDPLRTCFRFIHLTVLFVPVLISLPIVLFGSRDARQNVPKGAVLWVKYFTWTMELAGPSFIKLGQWAASRTDIFPDVFCTEMGKLHSKAKPHSLRATRKIIRKAFGGLKFDEIFEEFNEEPLGVGAMAQVYKAKLNPELRYDFSVDQDGGDLSVLEKRLHFKFKKHFSTPPSNWVVIKVLHPNVDRLVERDLKIMRFFANLLNMIPTMEWLSLPGEVEMFAAMMGSQLDLRIEAANLLRFRENFKGKLDVKFPRPYGEYTSREVLVEEFISGVPMTEMLRHTSHYRGRMEKEVSNKGLDAFLKMLLLDNFIHSDLHPGNIYVRLYNRDKIQTTSSEQIEEVADKLMSMKDDFEAWQQEIERLYEEGYRPQVCFIDAGLVTELNASNRRNFLDLFKAISMFDGYKVGELMIERSRTPETAIDGEVFALKVERLVMHIKERTFALGSVRLGDLLWRVLGMVRQHHVRMEGDFITVVLSILLLEGIGRQLDPELDLFKSSLPILRQLGPNENQLPVRDQLSMAKVWLALEVRQFISASIQDIHNLVKYDRLCPNV